ncbi:MAG: LacI family DNA-binding transcriptional regulator [Clostridia bacterium]|nr:LacI family DNA-binding transcriptional regulator [Clostridia bacterium]NCC43977.1 LacI family DNA-binding transcriptional regulator [Clostridia bacterium]
MAGTIQQIADLAGVSRGTVDRALNHRGRIRPDVAEKIQKIADEIGYQSNRSKKAERTDNRSVKIGVVTQLSKSSFMLQVNQGVQDAKRELEERGAALLWKDNVTVDEHEQLQAIEQLVSEGIQGLALMPIECESIRLKINELVEEKKIPVITFNSDIVGTKRICFVGLDNKRSGFTAAGLMGMLTRGSGKILTITGYFTNSVNSLRVEGFIQEAKQSYPELELLGVQSSFDDADEVERIIVSTLDRVPDLKGIFVASAGQAGVRRALDKLNLEKRPYVIVYDITPRNVQALEAGDVDFLIDQEAYVQGNRPPLMLYDLLVKGQEPDQEYIFTDINIKTKYNI